MFVSDPKLKMCAVVKLKRREMNKQSRKSGQSTSHLPIREDVSTSDNLSEAPEKSEPHSSFIETFSSKGDVSKSDSHNSVAVDEKALHEFLKLLNIPKRTVTTQVYLVEDVLQGSEAVAVETQTESRYADLVGVIQRIMLRLPKSDGPP
jgi:hypothetical protein